MNREQWQEINCKVNEVIDGGHPTETLLDNDLCKQTMVLVLARQLQSMRRKYENAQNDCRIIAWERKVWYGKAKQYHLLLSAKERAKDV